MDLETKKTHFLRGLNWELAEGIYKDLAGSATWDKLVAKAKRHETMRIKRSRAQNLQQGKYHIFILSNYYADQASLCHERES